MDEFVCWCTTRCALHRGRFPARQMLISVHLPCMLAFCFLGNARRCQLLCRVAVSFQCVFCLFDSHLRPCCSASGLRALEWGHGKHHAEWAALVDTRPTRKQFATGLL